MTYSTQGDSLTQDDNLTMFIKEWIDKPVSVKLFGKHRLGRVDTVEPFAKTLTVVLDHEPDGIIVQVKAHYTKVMPSIES